jgi:hypothetical protein
MKCKMALVIGMMVALMMYVGYVRTDAQTSSVEFLVEHGAVVVVSGDGASDVVVVTGRSVGLRTGLGACVPDASDYYNVQFGLAVDPGEKGRTARYTQLIPISPNVALSPGTRFTNLTIGSTCTPTDGSESFDRVRGTIE